ncbi:MAG: AMP-binding protein, partial [Actinobacteria bacterium]|nr:AMP-binding protein [Actinomycetota bacterium]
LDTATRLTPAFLETTLAIAKPRLSREIADAYRAPYRSAARRHGIRDFVADIPVDPDHSSFAELTRIATGIRSVEAPSLFLWGPADPIFSDRYLDDLIARRPTADVHRFEGAGHLVAEDRDIATPLFEWLDAVPVERAPAADAPAEEPRVPLWAQLDDRSADADIAVVEMAPPGGGAARSISWRQLSARVRDIAAGLAGLGVRSGDRVSLLVPPGADLTAALYACLRLGAVVVVADAGLGASGLTRAVRGAQPDYVIGARRGLMAARALGWPGVRISTATLPPFVRRALGVTASLPQLADRGRELTLPPAPEREATAAVLFTSGSTGPAKGVVYSHRALEALRDLLAARYGVGPGIGLVAGFAPFALLGPALGARTATPDMDVTAPATLTAAAVAEAVRAVDAAVLFLSPAAIANVVATASALTSAQSDALQRVRLALSAGAPVPAALLDRAARLMPHATLHTPYGMTEGLLLSDITLDEIHAAEAEQAEAEVGLTGGGVCVGRPAPGVEVRIAALDIDGRASTLPDAAVGVTGEIVVSAPHLKNEYDRLFLTDLAAARGTSDLEGGSRWHRTGDVGHIDERGRLWVEGRMPHVIVTADGPVTPVAVELRIGELDDVARAALAGVGPVGTAQLVAVVETEPAAPGPGLASAELTARVRAAAGLPLAAVLVVAVLPTDIRHNSKIERTRLSRWAEDVLSGDRMTAP